MSANLAVIGFVRAIQIGLAVTIFYKAYHLQVTSTVEVFCPAANPPAINYKVEYPFAEVKVSSLSDCSSEPTNITDTFSTGFGPTSYLFTTSVVISVFYSLAAIAFYCLQHQNYDEQKRLPAVDLLVSLGIGVVWAITAYLAWTNYPEMRKQTNPDSIQLKATLCRDTGAYCSSFSPGNWGDMNTYLFLGIANILGWGISVWFIFMETGLYTEDEEDEMDILDGNGFGGSGATFVAFPELLDKSGVARLSDPYGGPGGKPPMDDDQLASYINNWKNSGGKLGHSDDGDRFANGLTFTPIVPSVSEGVYEKEYQESVVPIKVHNKWNMFQA